MNNNYNIFWGIIFIYALGLFLCVMIPSEANAATEVNTTTNSDSEVVVVFTSVTALASLGIITQRNKPKRYTKIIPQKML